MGENNRKKIVSRIKFHIVLKVSQEHVCLFLLHQILESRFSVIIKPLPLLFKCVADTYVVINVCLVTRIVTKYACIYICQQNRVLRAPVICFFFHLTKAISDRYCDRHDWPQEYRWSRRSKQIGLIRARSKHAHFFSFLFFSSPPFSFFASWYFYIAAFCYYCNDFSNFVCLSRLARLKNPCKINVNFVCFSFLMFLRWVFFGEKGTHSISTFLSVLRTNPEIHDAGLR